MNNYKRLPDCNSWGTCENGDIKLPDELQKCRDKNHEMHSEQVGHPKSGITRHYCEICKIYYHSYSR